MFYMGNWSCKLFSIIYLLFASSYVTNWKKYISNGKPQYAIFWQKSCLLPYSLNFVGLFVLATSEIVNTLRIQSGSWNPHLITPLLLKFIHVCGRCIASRMCSRVFSGFWSCSQVCFISFFKCIIDSWWCQVTTTINTTLASRILLVQGRALLSFKYLEGNLWISIKHLIVLF